ncbi:hypothetical protein ACDH70_01865 [Xanthomonas axonopodis pv. poinsettiicola]
MSKKADSRYLALAPLVPAAHTAQLLRDLQIINDRVMRELGALPRKGLPVQAKRKPKPAPWAAAAHPPTPQDAEMHDAPQPAIS